MAQLGPLLQSPSEAAVTVSARAGLPSDVLGAAAELPWLAELSSGVAGPGALMPSCLSAGVCPRFLVTWAPPSLQLPSSKRAS